jgi:hypothetical protein
MAANLAKLPELLRGPPHDGEAAASQSEIAMAVPGRAGPSAACELLWIDPSDNRLLKQCG